MKHFRLRSSLLRQIIVLLGCAIALFWLIIESVNFYSRYATARNTIKNDLQVELSASVSRESNHYLQAQRTLSTLLDLWLSTPDRSNLAVVPQHAVFIPLPDARINPEQQQKALALVELFGHSSEEMGEEAFILLPQQGMAYFQSAGTSEQASLQRAHTLLAESTGLSEAGFHWGTPFRREDTGQLYVPLTTRDPRTGVVVGMDVQVWRMPMLNHELQHDIRFAMLGENDQFLPLATFEKAIPVGEFPFEAMSRCQSQGQVEVGNYHFACEDFTGPPWWMVVRYPERQVALSALGSQLWTLPPVLLALLLLLFLLYWGLDRLLGMPLRHLMRVIERHSFLDWTLALPEGRKDELGRIAKAYNRMLSILKANSSTLESRVQERTSMLKQATDIAEEMSKRKSEHIASASHEIRTPMNSVVGALELLHHSDLTPAQRDLVQTARTSSDYLLSLINNLLDYNHIETGQLELSTEQVDLLPMLDKVMTTVHLRAEEKGLALTCIVAAGVPLDLELSRIRVKQILINLLGNAIKFTHQGYVHLRVERRKSLLVFAVKDSGEGIAANQQQEIFRPFARVSEHSGGNGLGLTISAMLAQSMGGEIQLTSQPGKGSCFTLLLPIQQGGKPLEPFTGSVKAPEALHEQLEMWGLTAFAGEDPALTSPALVFQPGRLYRLLAMLLQGEHFTEPSDKPMMVSPWMLKILVVDDNAVNRDIIQKTLRHLGHEAETAASGKEALKRGQQHVYDLVLMDLRMPEMDGYTTTRNWRDPHWNILDAETPVIALTADALKSERERARECGMVGFLTKPFEMAKLLNALEKVMVTQLSQGRELTPNAALYKPLVDLTQDEELRAKVAVTFRSFIQELNHAWQNHQSEELTDMMHTIKGSAGLCNMPELYRSAELLETDLRAGRWPERGRLDAFIALISDEIEMVKSA
ncbi:two component system sensor kinase [Pantoea cypripedii]|uniref:histidine kinase n=1 Tax=Pantoea cypripedii TaxID=55209 RepID=A0A6B9G8K3_PANCY|nr:two component system sensor kinase [Pantoea cypripedii]QGY32153.1 hybrid sensor histidine kinase/response regulator [Pantoea cypripedii]